ncbi:MAG: hypothetical protein HRT87_06345 [Legionellales bacterium]|nr:hypothetical protein [Legionellales bacterium]
MDNTNLLGITKLLFDIKAPSLEECWEEGFEMANSLELSDNPYQKGTANYYHWQDGWWSRKFGIEEIELSLEYAANDTEELSSANSHKYEEEFVVSEV